MFNFLAVVQRPISCLSRLIVEVSRSHTVRHKTLGRTPPNEWSARRRGRCLHNTQQTQDLSGIRTCDPSNQAAAGLRLRPVFLNRRAV